MYCDETGSSSLPTGALPVLKLVGDVLLPQATRPLWQFDTKEPSEFTPADGQREWLLVVPAEEGGLIGPSAHLAEIGCLARLICQAAEGSAGVMLIKGIQRVRMPHPPERGAAVRMSQFEVLPDEYSDTDFEQRMTLRKALAEHLVQRCPEVAQQDLPLLLEAELSLGALCDLAAEMLTLSFHQRCDLLRETNVDVRCRSLLAALSSEGGKTDHRFSFGMN